MADLIAILAIAAQYYVVILIVNWYLGSVLTFGTVLGGFLALATLGLASWHQKRFSQTVKQWRKLTLSSVILGIAFFGSDLFWAYLHGHANPFLDNGGLLGLPLTFLVCPGATMICLAGIVRAFLISRRARGTE